MANEVEVIDTIIMEWLLAPQADPLTSSSSSSSSSDDGEPPRTISRVENYVETIVPAYSDISFREHFRLSRVVMYKLIGLLEHSKYQPELKNTHISAEKSFLLCVWYLSNTESFRQVADRFDVSLSSAHRILIRVLNFILTLRNDFIKWPNDEQKTVISSEFQKKRGFKGVVGCIDGSHFRIWRPTANEEAYVNRKGFHSLLLQAVVDNRRMFTDIYCGEPGSLHDARLLRKSGLFTRAQDPHFFGNYYLLGDSAYPSLDWLVPPFRDNGNLSRQQKEFNFRLSSTRIVAEHAFGLLNARFRRLEHFENLNLKIIVKCLMSACILHNICIIKNDADDILCVDPVSGNMEAEHLDDIFHQPPGKERRKEIFEEMFNINF